MAVIVQNALSAVWAWEVIHHTRINSANLMLVTEAHQCNVIRPGSVSGNT